MAKKPKDTAPVAPVMTAAITLAMVAHASASDPYFLYVPSEVSAEWLAAGLVEANPDMKDGDGAVATRITEAGRNYLAMNDTTNTAGSGTEATNSAASTPADNGTANEFAIELIDMPTESRSPAASNATRYPFDQLPAPTTGEDGKPKAAAFFIPSTPARPKPWESLASTVSTAKSRFAKKIGEREYAAKEAVKNPDGTPVLGADGKPTFKEVKKMRDINEYERVFRIVEGVKKVKTRAEDGSEVETEVKGAWVSRTK